MRSPTKYLRIGSLCLLNIISGASNASLIYIITLAINGENQSFNFSGFHIGYIFLSLLLLYIISRKIVETQLVKITFNYINKIRLKLYQILSNSKYSYFESVGIGKIHSTLNNDTEIVGSSINTLVSIITNFLTITFVFLYLLNLSVPLSIFMLIIAISLSILYFFVSKRTIVHWEQARDIQNEFIALIDGLFNGIKELSMHKEKNNRYREEFKKTCDKYMSKKVLAAKRFIDTNIFGEVLFVGVIGVIAIALPILIAGIKKKDVISFTISSLYLIGPICSIMYNIPIVLKMNISFKRIKAILKHVDVNCLETQQPDANLTSISPVQKFTVRDLNFEYKEDQKPFRLGPINFSLDKGQILFIAGKNGCGKTTLLKLLTGLYSPDSGRIFINNTHINSNHLGKYFSGVFCDFHLLKNIHNFDSNLFSLNVSLLRKLKINPKILTYPNFDFEKLSQGERKRIALLFCFLDNRPIYFFDEWAADQDWYFKQYFYKVLLKEMKSQGKIVIVITHDKNYFKSADKVLIIENGKSKVYKHRISHSQDNHRVAIKGNSYLRIYN